ncbi:MAG TPA: SRPBCC family protein [Actinomycetota bacterium]|nr:SRPBCC family protein [Actinomycetota bacterium]
MHARCSTTIDAPPTRVYDTILDPYAFPKWVVGARRIRGVDEDWPAVMTSFHHEVGVWPLTIKDKTTMLGHESDSLVRLRARAWPAGEAEVRIKLEDTGGGTLVTIEEEPAAGPLRAMWNPMLVPALHARNQVSLQRLKKLVEQSA